MSARRDPGELLHSGPVRCAVSRIASFSDGGRDGIKGGKDADDLSAQELNDTIFGEGGDDFLRGGSGFDVCRGGAGADSFFGCEDVR